MKKAEKPLFVANLTEELKTTSACLLLNYAGLSVAAQRELKKRLKTVGARFLVSKNTLFRLAGQAAKLPQETLADSVLQGQTALVLTEGDPLAPIQIVAKFAQEFEVPQFKVAIIEGQFTNQETLLALSLLPSKEILSAQVVGSLSAPMSQIVGVLEGNLQKLVFILKTKGGE